MAKKKDNTPAFTIKWAVMRRSGNDRREAARYDTEEEAIKDLESMFAKDVMGTLEYTIEKVWTNKTS